MVMPKRPELKMPLLRSSLECVSSRVSVADSMLMLPGATSVVPCDEATLVHCCFGTTAKSAEFLPELLRRRKEFEPGRIRIATAVRYALVSRAESALPLK
jgi:hypothetical protein